MSHPNVGLILWAKNAPNDHSNHLHVEPTKVFKGWTDGRGDQPPNPASMTDGLRQIYEALTDRFGNGYYFLNDPPDVPNWSHMGMYNRRPVAGSIRWSQHAYYNAIDIGPLYGVEEQQFMFDFLTGKDHEMATEIIAGQKWFDVDLWPSWADVSIRKNIVDGVIRGKDVRDKNGNIIGKRFDPNAPLTRAEAAVLLDRIDAV